MATSKIKSMNSVVIKEDSVSVEPNAVTTLTTIDTTDTNAYYHICLTVTAAVTVSGKYLRARMTGLVTQTEMTNGVSAQAVKVIKGNGSIMTLQCSHDATSTQTIKYRVEVIKLS